MNPSIESGVVAESAAMQRVLATLADQRASRQPVLLVGEPGVGKELLARALHRASPLAAGPFVALNCGTIAVEEVVGGQNSACSSAEDGALFLDEIAELPRELQRRLLEHVRSDPPPWRLIAATSRDLETDVRAGLFEPALAERLLPVAVTIEPLRHRPEDIEPLAVLFARRYGVELPAPVVARLRSHKWPGNVRELRDSVHGYAANRELHLESPVHVDLERPYVEQRDELGERFTKTYLLELLVRARGNLSQAARIAKLDRSYLSRLLARAGINARQPVRD